MSRPGARVAAAERLSPRRLLLAAAVLAACVALGGADGVGEYQVKAAFLYNFARFVDWPPGAARDGEINLCILGYDPFGEDTDMIAGKSVGQAKLQVRRVTRQTSAGCQMLFISGSEASELDAVLAGARGRPVLTVADTPGFAERGVVVNFYLEQGKVRFEINIDAAGRTGLNISSQLLRLARLVHDQGEAHG